MNSNLFIEQLKIYRGDNVFNPYSDICAIYDKSNASEIRSKNLLVTLDAFLKYEVDSIWVGRDLGHRGGRRTGLALTDEAHLGCAADVWNVQLHRATKGQAFSERTATNIWDSIRQIDEKIFMWNVFPFHPYEEGNQFTNRNHTSRERDFGMQIMEVLVSLMRPTKIIAIGNDAYHCSLRILPHKRIYKIRHPSYGGEKAFFKQLNEVYGSTYRLL